MKIKRRRTPLQAAAAHQDDSTPEVEARTEPTVHRRTTVTVERETLSILVRRPAAGPAPEPAAQPVEGEIVPAKTLSEERDRNLPSTLRNELSEGKL
jgi:hypothetical protein